MKLVAVQELCCGVLLTPMLAREGLVVLTLSARGEVTNLVLYVMNHVPGTF